MVEMEGIVFICVGSCRKVGISAASGTLNFFSTISLLIQQYYYCANTHPPILAKFIAVLVCQFLISGFGLIWAVSAGWKHFTKSQQLLNHRNQFMQLSFDQLGSMLGEGAFGWVFALKNSSDIAVKLTKHSPLQLLKEAKVLKMMAHTALFPNLISTGTIPLPPSQPEEEESYMNFMAMERLGISLEELLALRNNRLSVSTIRKVGRQLLRKIRLLHQKNIIHNDIKPTNILFGLHQKRAEAYLIDFGLAQLPCEDMQPYDSCSFGSCCSIDGQVDPCPSFRGSLMFASLAKLKGRMNSKSDDLESLIIVLMWLVEGGSLPWQSFEFAQHNNSTTSDTVIHRIRRMIHKREEFIRSSQQSAARMPDSERSEFLADLHNELRSINATNSSPSIGQLYQNLEFLL